MDLETIQDNAWLTLSTALEAISVRSEAERSGSAYGAVCLMYHRLALCEMLAEARADRFQVLLCKSALARAHLLRLAARGRPFPALTLCASKNFSFVDAAAAGQLELAAEIARLTPDQHDPKYEYEDDFLLHRFMQKLLLHIHKGEEHDLPALLQRWKEVVEREHAPYLEVCQALLHKDEEGFNKALFAVIDERAHLFQQKDVFPVDARRTDGALFMNGLALLRLAALSGMRTQREYPNIPHLARLPPRNLLLPPNAWMSPDEGLPE